jgi:putative protease
MIKKVELLAPSGSYEKGKVALDYGADAIYLGAKAYSLRARASNFDDQELMKISQLVHRDGRK